jgi:hypothetical protein
MSDEEQNSITDYENVKDSFQKNRITWSTLFGNSKTEARKNLYSKLIDEKLPYKKLSESKIFFL